MKIAIIPARGGSKRIPRKNIKAFHGKPMIAYSIEAATASGCFDKVIVSTDDVEIANVAKGYGAEVPFLRPAEISDDYATTMDVMAHAIRWCESEGWYVEAVCCLYATAPFVLPSDLQRGYRLLENDQQVQFAFSATSFPFPIQRAIKLDEHDSVTMFDPEHEQTRSQDLEEAYHDAGQFYWGQTNAFLNKLSIFSPHSKAVQLPRSRVQDIDTQEDWELAEALYSAFKLTEK
ncbi:pseudaminic acid cytidylyltransferase [Vibrio sp. J383]|uniref:pseudaminic acid cytidylyltransferase n=1 Tax=Vibrio sp. J383 TaxID=2942997 RepID=UPI000C85286E|nr:MULTISPECIES: pseudaminic acid cytidylyltransferase [Vibrio]MCZ8501949.1 pseudaminic acid cytidylyltransferase [Vibrio lentus]PMH62645.1 pseudaminic acid cytidylyltransferase [Vibrio lentus]UQV21848.1 pseudaminic acid cytidylyltransferase [Vibrio sp. J383]